MSNSPHQNVPPNDDATSDIPLARRQPAEISLDEIEQASTAMQPKAKQRKNRLPAVLILVASLVGLGAWQWPWLSPRVEGVKEAIAAGNFRLGKDTEPINPTDATPDPQSGNSNDSAPDIATAPTADGIPTESIAADGSVEPEPVEPAEPAEPAEPDTLLNHRRYEEAPQSELLQLNPNSTLKLRPAAQASVNAMIAKAKSEGVQLGIVSGFRTLEDQDYLYFKVKAERGQSAKTRAEVSAPPGYSEHHTGYAVDLIDESKPDTHVEESFETTPAYQWLEKNAAFFNFEMSFPKDNESAVQYEPWHWRYVGDQNSLETFYAR